MKVIDLNMRRGNSNVVVDRTHNHHHGTITGPRRVWNAGMMFDGSNDYVNLGTSILLDPVSFTFESLFYARSAHAARRIIAYNPTTDGGISKLLEVSITLPAVLTVGVYTGSWPVQQATIDFNKWYHCCVTWDGSTLKSYLDGVQFASDVLAIAAYSSAYDTWIGGNANNPAPAYSFDGLIGAIRTHNTAFTPSEVIKQYHESKIKRWKALL